MCKRGENIIYVNESYLLSSYVKKKKHQCDDNTKGLLSSVPEAMGTHWWGKWICATSVNYILHTQSIIELQMHHIHTNINCTQVWIHIPHTYYDVIKNVVT